MHLNKELFPGAAGSTNHHPLAIMNCFVDIEKDLVRFAVPEAEVGDLDQEVSPAKRRRSIWRLASVPAEHKIKYTRPANR